MKLIKSSAEIIEQQSGWVGVQKQIEKAGRICWKSEDRITDDSYKKFIERLKGYKHGSPFEFGTIYLVIKLGRPIEDKDYLYKVNLVFFFKKNKYSRVNEWKYVDDNGNVDEYPTYYITTNYRVVLENSLPSVKVKSLLDIISPFIVDTPYDKHDKRVCAKIICNRAIANEIVRHRVFSFCQESSRYCNYSKDKFGNELTFIIPSISNLKEGYYGSTIENNICCEIRFSENKIQNENDYDNAEIINTNKFDLLFVDACTIAEYDYLQMIEADVKPENARDVLPLATKTEIMVCGFVDDWKKFFELRKTNAAHLDIKNISEKLENDFINKKLF